MVSLFYNTNAANAKKRPTESLQDAEFLSTAATPTPPTPTIDESPYTDATFVDLVRSVVQSFSKYSRAYT